MKTKTLHRLLSFITIIGISTMMAFAETVTKGRVTIQYESMPDGSVKVLYVKNENDKRITLQCDGTPIYVNANSSARVNQYAQIYIRYDFVPNGGGQILWRPTPKKEPAAKEPSPVQAEPNEENVVKETKHEERQADIVTGENTSMSSDGAALGYFDKLNQDEFFGMDAVKEYTQKVETFYRSINTSKNKSQFIIDNDVEQFLEQSEKDINDRKSNLAATAQEIVSASNLDEASQASAMTLIVETLNNRLKTREDAYEKLNTLVSDVNSSNSTTEHSQGNRIANYIIVIAIIIIIILSVVAVRRIKNQRNKLSKSTTQSTASHDSSADNPMIVVRRRTTSILKKQSIDDVIDNPAYLVIDTAEFTPDSAVQKIYIRNSCIKDVYNLYAEDLRNTENPKEDGCMVLGRWVHDEETNTYDISLEEVVFPGDDAVFKEYELNFGGKIKLRIAERLRKLRRDTNLQYDLVCWIHSHPGLGVFFSNSDDNVQMQLKHSKHPNFLIAFVVDILTSNQELGIFTFRKDGSMNSKGDITKMYSLEEMYKWTLQSERSSFSHDNYFNIIDNAKFKLPACKGVELNNNSIIDLSQIVIEPETGIVGWAIGTTVENNGNQEYVVSSIIRNSAKPGTGVIGCLISMTHMSFPTIQKLIAGDSINLSFVMVYSSKQRSLTTIPVINDELISNEQFYGDVNIDDLKIWTRRKR